MSNDPKLIVNMVEGEEDRVKKLAKRFEGMIKEYKVGRVWGQKKLAKRFETRRHDQRIQGG